MDVVCAKWFNVQEKNEVSKHIRFKNQHAPNEWLILLAMQAKKYWWEQPEAYAVLYDVAKSEKREGDQEEKNVWSVVSGIGGKGYR